MRTLITNDDGIDSPGIRVLAGVAIRAGLDVVIAAPSWDSSGASASLTAVEHDGRLLFEERELDDVDAPAYAVEAAPAFIVRAAATGAFGPAPDLVLSGVNLGPNTGHAVLHSGTVGAALTGWTNGARAMAISVEVGPSIHWDTVVSVASVTLRWVMDSEAANILNVNVPNVAPEDLAGIRRAKLAAFGAVQATITERGQGWVSLSYTGVDADHEPGTDAALLAAGVATFTPLRAVCESEDVNTDELDQLVASCVR